jgi:ParB-like chromosome segregation protein Spo0J
MIALNEIEPRAYGSWGMVLRYASMLRELKKAPPIVLARQNTGSYRYSIVDGAHRYHAAKEARRLKIKAVIASQEGGE